MIFPSSSICGRLCQSLLFLFALISFFLYLKPESKEGMEPIIRKIGKQIDAKERTSIPYIVAIGGCPGVGKSTFTDLLKANLAKCGIDAEILRLDHYHLSLEARKQFDNELDPRRIEWHKLHATLANIKNGARSITKPVVNQLTTETDEETLDLQDVAVLLFEGSYVLGDSPPIDFLPYADMAIYLETSLENIYDWKWQRELKKTQVRTPSVFFQHMMNIVGDFAFHVYPTRKNADYIVQIDRKHAYTISDRPAIEISAEPNFTPYRLEMLAY